MQLLRWGLEHLQRIALSFPQSIWKILLAGGENEPLLLLKPSSAEAGPRSRCEGKLVLDLSSVVQLRSLESFAVLPCDTPIELQGLGLLRDVCFLILTHISSSSKCVEEIAYLTNLQVLELNSWEGEYTTRFPVLNGVTFSRAGGVAYKESWGCQHWGQV